MHLFTDSQWTALVEIFERFYGLGDIERAMEYRRERAEEPIERNVEPPLCRQEPAPDEESDYFISAGVRELPNGQLSILEAAYEHLGDFDGMRRLLMYYILGDCIVYRQCLVMLRELCGEEWPAQSWGQCSPDRLRRSRT